ncbi:DNA polymerase [Trinickia symbiotica]|uniref:Type-4 uracil-DNA glycosylase n=2 Tax=Trinickia symbiotica TaxID=863227 RepID=A0A2N7X0V1_9BURK|nr:uracil-DNA glycosylase [Trinickia symbiotica]PMS35212.1 uracil-DNA glycosylase [Trinickia symbiotica]PPK43769.1 DNA polymerase [Trinickia symbiotica]
MAFDEAALETLGLAPIWVRRGERTATTTPTATAETSSGGDRGATVPATTVAGPAVAARQATKPVPPVEPTVRAQTDSIENETAFDDFHPSGADVSPPAASVETTSAVSARSSNTDASEPGVAALDWEALEARVAACQLCRLCERRTKTVFGVGDREADWMLIGEGPGENEDKQGEPFVGQAGKLLDSMLHALELARGRNVYIANVVKCRPPGNRNPEPDEVARCEPYLQRQVELVKPKLIVALGRVAAQNLLKTDASISSLRGRVHRYQDVPVIVTYHPAYLLRSLTDKAKAWVDLCLAQDTYRRALAEQAER